MRAILIAIVAVAVVALVVSFLGKSTPLRVR
jgi:hypothetical protein